MCRFLVYHGRKKRLKLADLLTKPTHSIIHQSFNSKERFNLSPLNGDGFGVGWYESCDGTNETPCVFVSVTPAWNNLNCVFLEFF